jgi:hypothetical protein
VTPAAHFDPWEDLREQVKRHEKDLYHGNGKPALTIRMDRVEVWQDEMRTNVRWILGLVVTVLLTVVGEILVKVIH